MASKRAKKIDAVLRHLAAGGEIQDFPGTKYENLALARSVERRGLVLWDKEGHRFVLTPAGWAQLTPRRFGLPSMVVSTAVGAAIGAAVLAFLWLPGFQGRDSAYGHATASLVSEKPVVAAAAPPVDGSGRSLARVPTSPASTDPAPAAATAPAAMPVAATEPAQAAAEPIAEQPDGPAPSTVKQTHKSHHRSARHSDQHGNWRAQRYADPRYDLGSPRYSYSYSYSYR
ncbi:MAG: hypothetical protein JO328_06725 [Hyphomicrobiales bacterium]|nr:hypothetical protein [Hyphomicrobiales bacterium]MBV8825317.1 hypothetical protein [Hyphomicrobiales bacterium]